MLTLGSFSPFADLRNEPSCKNDKSKEGRDGGKDRDEESDMAAQIGGIGIVLVLIVVVFASASVLPICPTITLAFEVKTQGYGQTPTITLTSVLYQKVPFLSYLSSERDKLVLSRVTAQEGEYSLSVTVRYGDAQISQGGFPTVGNGIYQLRISYFPRTEDSKTPYQFDLNLASPFGSPPTLSVDVYPS